MRGGDFCMKNILSGKKTYIGCAVLAIYAVAGLLIGKVEPVVAGELVLESIVFAMMRLGISK